MTERTRAHTYGAGGAGPHAVTAAGPHTYVYDNAGNQTLRSLNGGAQVMALVYDAMNRLVETSGHGSDLVALYDASGTRVKRALGDVTTFYIGEDYEIESGPVVAEDTVGLHRPSNNVFCMSNDLTSLATDVSGTYGSPGDISLTGDWNGDGVDGIGLYRPAEDRFFLKNSPAAASSDEILYFGAGADIPLVGDWDGDGVDTPAIYRPSNGKFYLKNDFSSGSVFALTTGAWGLSGDDPVAGNWNGTIGHDGEQITVNYSVAGMSVGSTINGELWVGVSDHLGSGSVVRDSDGDTRVQRYTPFGAVRAPSLESGLPTDEGFAGQTADPGLGLVDYNARAYDPLLGRFVMADTVLDGLNRYSYVRNNPLRYTDPTGHCLGGWWCPTDTAERVVVDLATELGEEIIEQASKVDNVANSALGVIGLCHVYGDSGQGCTAYKDAHAEGSQRVANLAAGMADGLLFGVGDNALNALGQEGKYDPKSAEFAVGEVAGVGINARLGGGYAAVANRFIAAGVGEQAAVYAASDHKSEAAGALSWNVGVIGFTWWLPGIVTGPALAAGQVAATTGAKVPRFARPLADAINAAWTVASVYAGSGNGGSWFW